MKKAHSTLVFSLFIALLALPALPVSALSCLPTADYIASVVADENIQIFTGTTQATVQGTDYTAERLTVTAAHQGYVESTLFVYHQKDETWGYLCNSGPKADGATSIYITERDTFGKYNVHQRLDASDTLAKSLLADIADADVTGDVTEITPTDRRNQIMTTIQDLLREIGILLREYTLWGTTR